MWHVSDNSASPFSISYSLRDQHQKILKINMLLGVKFEDVRHTKTFTHKDKYIDVYMYIFIYKFVPRLFDL